MQTLAANIRRRFVDSTTIVRRIIHATEMYVKRRVVAIKIVWPMNDAFAECVEPFVTATLPVDKDKFVKIVCVKLDVEVITSAPVKKLASIISVRIHVQRPVNVVRVQNALSSIMVFSAVAQLVSLETR